LDKNDVLAVQDIPTSTQFSFGIDPRERRLIDRAAKIERRSTSDLVRLAAVDKAAEVIGAEKK